MDAKPHTFEITISDGICTYKYDLRLTDDICIRDIYLALTDAFGVESKEGRPILTKRK